MWLGDDAAANVLTSAEYASSTNLGAEGDASSLENVEKTFQLMRDGNAIRAELGLGELKVTSTLMAYAVSDCNWSYNKMQHAQQFNVGENLAWGYGTAAYDRNSSVYSNPFRGWYDEEKQAFDDAVASGNYPGLASMSAWKIYSKYPDLFQEVGHYLNVIDPDYTVTGFAYNNASGALYGCASGQVFDYSSNGDTVYTVNEYAAKFAEYKKIAGSDAKERLAAAKQKQSEAQARVSQSQSAVADAQSATQVAYNESVAAKSAYGQAQEKTAHANALAYNGVDTAYVGYSEYAYLNEYVNKVKQDNGNVESAKRASDQAAAEQQSAQNEFDRVGAEYAQAVQQREAAQRAYDQFGEWKHDSIGWWYEFPDGGYVYGSYLNIDGVPYFFDESGYMHTGWLNAGNGEWRYFEASGAMARNQWESIGGTWYWFDVDGLMATGWTQIGETWYYMNSSGAMQAGWLNLGGAWYWLQSSGAMATGWTNVGGTWYWFNEYGAMATGWLQTDGSWYYLDGSGAMRTGWISVGGSWFYLNGSGSMQTGWLNLGGSWYYLNESGAMLIGWQVIGGTDYYFYSSGVMAANTWVGDYYLTGSGAMAKSTRVGNYYVDANGACVYNVCWTRYGEKYHRDFCPSIKGHSVTNGTIYQAWNKGLDACNVCFPK